MRFPKCQSRIIFALLSFMNKKFRVTLSLLFFLTGIKGVVIEQQSDISRKI
jgi:hypothetical protein